MTTAPFDLFSWKPSSCAMIAFPQDRRIGRAREVARKAFDMGEYPKKAESYRRHVLEQLGQMLTDRGIAPDEADSQVRAFAMIVDREIERLKVMSRLGLIKQGGAA